MSNHQIVFNTLAAVYNETDANRAIEENLLSILVYPESMTIRYITESPGYNIYQFASDLGNT